MKHALLVEVPDWDALYGPMPASCAETMAALLEELGGWSIVQCKGMDSTRERVLAALGELLGTCGPGDTCLFHFFGHGGMARFPELGEELGARELFYLATLRPPGTPRVGVHDFELSDALTRLDAICGNVTAIIDCCHAGSMVRSAPSGPTAWLEPVGKLDLGRALAAESHPRIVRLAGASSRRTAYARSGSRGPCGLVTQGFVDVVREAGLRCDRLTWDAVAHRIREQASGERGTEEQRVVLAGPRHRLVFSTTTVPLPRSAAYLPRPDAEGGPGRGWLRAGALQGVRVGDRWSVAALALDDSLAPRLVADLRIERVELDRSEVSVIADAPVELPAGTSALLREVEERMPVVVEGSAAVASAIDRSGWLFCAPFEPIPAHRVIVREHGSNGSSGHEPPTASTSPTVTDRPLALELLDPDGHPSWRATAAASEATRALVELLEDRARTARLRSAITALAPTAATDVPLRLRWGIVGPDGRRITLPSPAPGSSAPRPRLHAGDRLWLELEHAGATPPHWFATVIELGVDGRPRLLNAREPDGLELAPGSSVRIGLRGERAREGLRLVWPAAAPEHDPRPMTLVVLASQRPLPLGHLVRIADPDDDAAFVTQDLPPLLREVARGHVPPAPIASRGWTVLTMELELDPHPRRNVDPPAPGTARTSL
jgi:hypothetical protein